MKYRIDLIWKEQAVTTSPFEKMLLKEITSIGCYIGTLGIAKKKIILFELSNTIRIQNLDKKRFAGVEIQMIDGGSSKYLSIILLEPSLYEVFLQLGDDLLVNAAKSKDEKDAIKNIFKTINDWRKLFERVNNVGLSVEQQIGLYGELLMISLLIKEGVDIGDVLRCWTGPDAKNNDFQFTPLSIEVKTTVANHPVLAISNEHQLSYSNRLFLVLFILAERRGCINTLPALIDKLRHQFEGYDSELKVVFEDKLQSVGYDDIHRENYQDSEYLMKQINCYSVDDKFPRVVPENVRDGVFSVSYKIELSACSTHLVKLPELITQLLEDEGAIKEDTY